MFFNGLNVLKGFPYIKLSAFLLFKSVARLLILSLQKNVCFVCDQFILALMMTSHYLHQHICRRHTDSSSEKIEMQVQHLESTPELLSVMFLTK